jgi:hypothetical protein
VARRDLIPALEGYFECSSFFETVGMVQYSVIMRRIAIMFRVTIGTVVCCCNILRVLEVVWMCTCGCAVGTPGAAVFSVYHSVSAVINADSLFIQWNLGSRMCLITNKSVHEQIFRKKSLG